MPAIDFPNDPTAGQAFTSNGKTWIWSGSIWALRNTTAQLTAYDIAVNNGFVGTEAQWLTSLEGADGATGAAGPQGVPGPQGPSGTVSVTSPITNSGTSTAAVIGIDQSSLVIAESQVTNLTTDLAGKAPKILYETTVVSAGSKVLTNTSAKLQRFTGTTAGQIVILPDTSTLALGDQFTIMNNSSTQIFIKTSTSVTIGGPSAGLKNIFTVVSTSGNDSTAWDLNFAGAAGVTGAGVQTVLSTAPTISSPTFTGTATAAALTVNGTAKIKPVIETVKIEGTSIASGATYNFNITDSAIARVVPLGSFVTNIRGNAGTTLSSMLAAGESTTVTLVVYNGVGSSGYITSTIQIDSSTNIVRWVNGIAPTAYTYSGVNSYHDIYTFTILKIDTTPSYEIYGSYSRFGS